MYTSPGDAHAILLSISFSFYDARNSKISLMSSKPSSKDIVEADRGRRVAEMLLDDVLSSVGTVTAAACMNMTEEEEDEKKSVTPDDWLSHACTHLDEEEEEEEEVEGHCLAAKEPRVLPCSARTWDNRMLRPPFGGRLPDGSSQTSFPSPRQFFFT